MKSATKSKSSAASEERMKIVAYVVFGLGVAIYLYFQFRDPATPAASPSSPVIVTAPATSAATTSTAFMPQGLAVAGPAAKLVGTTSAALDPTLHMEAMRVTESVAYSGTGRNIFSALSAPPPLVIPKPIAPVRPVAVVTLPALPPQPCPPACPPPPAIPLKFFGIVENPPGSGSRKAFLLHGEDAYVAIPGEIVLRRYRVISIAPNSILMEDMSNNNKQSLPLAAN